MDHPDVTRIERTGHANRIKDNNSRSAMILALKDNKKELSISEFMKARFGK